jgi:hypothetical protein
VHNTAVCHPKSPEKQPMLNGVLPPDEAACISIFSFLPEVKLTRESGKHNNKIYRFYI